MSYKQPGVVVPSTVPAKSMTIDDLKRGLKTLIGRDVEVSRTKDGLYFVEYFNWSQRGIRPLHASEEEALKELYTQLTAQTTPSA
jgi:hypothetical protein